MSDTLYYVLSALLSVGVLLGIRWMSRVETAVRGNRLSALCMLAGIVLVLARESAVSSLTLWLGLLVGLALGVVLAKRVRMITMPQMVGLLNGLGGAASAIAAWMTLTQGPLPGFERATGELALAVGALTFTGSLVAAGKLHRVLPQKPVRLPNHQMPTALSFIIMALSLLLAVIMPAQRAPFTLAVLVSGLIFGLLFALPVGGADMPITISLLNSTSGVAAAIAGMAIGDALLVSVGGIVGASGLLLTQIMCRAMNRKLSAILLGKTAAPAPAALQAAEQAAQAEQAPGEPKAETPPEAPAEPKDAARWMREAQNAVIIPGYGMALSQAQEKVKKLYDTLIAGGKTVRFAIHPVAGRMPGHMNVLLAEADVPYDALFEMDDINPDMEKVDLAIVIGANDVVNPAANTAEGTPIYGMPVLEVARAKHVIIMNYDDKPGYAGVPNPLYQDSAKVFTLFGDAKESLDKLLA